MDQGDYKDYGTKLVQKYSIAVPKGADVIVDKINVSDSLTPGKKLTVWTLIHWMQYLEQSIM